MKLLLQGGQVVSGAGVAPLDVLISGETIEAVGPDLSCPDAQVVDVSGKLLFPGFIDAHTHFDLDVCNTTTADDFATGTRAALRGGTTTVIDFACPNKGETLQYGLQLWHRKADGKSSCDYGFHMTIDDWNEGIRGELPDMFAQGVSSFKMYLFKKIFGLFLGRYSRYEIMVCPADKTIVFRIKEIVVEILVEQRISFGRFNYDKPYRISVN